MTVWRMLIEHWITKATGTHSEFVVVIAFYCNSGCTNAPQCYVIHTLLVLFILSAKSTLYATNER